MKHARIAHLLIAALILSIGVEGCRPKPKAPTPIPSGKLGVDARDNTFPQERGQSLPPTTDANATPIPNPGVIPQVRPNLEDFIQNRDRFASDKVYFDFDRATIKPSETGKLDEVVSYLKANPTHAVQIEGHCDERGTEQYNLSLGERRALAAREYLVTAGIQPERVFTISYGESRPADPGHNEAAWAKNRRCEFVLLTPK